MLIIQVGVLLVSLDAYYPISAFCAGPASSWLAKAFGMVHVSFLVLLGLGIASLGWRAARAPYLIITVVGLLLLPVQATLVQSQILRCDFP